MNRSTRTMCTAAAVVCLLFVANAPGAIIIDSLDNGGSIPSNMEPGDSSGKAIGFTMPAGSDYTLTSVVMDLLWAGAGDDALLQLWSDDGTGAPIGSLLETLSDPATLVSGHNTFTSVGTTLEAGKTYWIVSRGEAGSFQWSGGNTDTSIDSDIGAVIAGRLFRSAGNGDGIDPGEWTGASSVPNHLQVNAEIVPEPASLVLLGMGGLMMLKQTKRA